MIEVKNLVKRYGNHTAVGGLSFTVEPGRIYGLLGPNGAGKSTTMNIMTGCLAATSGQVTVNGYDIFEDGEKAKRLIGYLPEQPPLYSDMTPREYLRFVARAKGVEGKQLAAAVDEAMAVTGVAAVGDRLIKNLSKGYCQRVGIAQAIIGSPEIIILDEPTVGLDPAQIIEIRELIRKLGEDHTVILSSHILSEVRAVCDEIMIISKGVLVACDSPENLETHFAGTRTVNITAKATAEEAAAALKNVAGVSGAFIQAEGETVKITLSAPPDADPCGDIFFAFAAIQKPIIRMSLKEPSLEDVFIELTKDAETGASAVVDTVSPAPEAANSADGAQPEQNTQKEEQNDDGGIL